MDPIAVTEALTLEEGELMFKQSAVSKKKWGLFFCKDFEIKCLNGWSDSEFLTAFMELVVMEMMAYGTDADIPMALRLFF